MFFKTTSGPKKCLGGMQGCGGWEESYLDKYTKDKAMAAILFGLEKALEDMLHRISDKYEIDYNELHQFVMVPTEADESSEFVEPPPGGVKPKAKPKAKGGEERVQCKGLTAKKTQCKKFAIGGGEFCACHQKKADEGVDPSEVKAKGKATKGKGKPKGKVEIVESDGESEVMSPIRVKGKAKGTPVTSPVMKSPPAAPKKKGAPPKHSHPMDEEDHEECDACKEHGNSAQMFSSPRYTVEKTAGSRLRNILAQMNAAAGSDTEDDE